MKNTWEKDYIRTENGLHRQIKTDDYAECFEIIFENNGRRYYCEIDAPNINEALGIFFINHQNISYNDIIDHISL